MERIQDHLSKVGQKAILRRIVKDGNRRYRIKIVSDSYEQQCSAEVAVWNGPTSGWSHVTSIDWSSMATPKGIAYKPDWNLVERFEDDFDYLLGVAMEVVNA